MPAIYQTGIAQQPSYPWNILLDNNNTDEALLNLIADDTLESRMKLLAFHQLRLKGYTVGNKELLGVIIEVQLEKGLDVLAAFKDGTARYINQSEKLIVWETQTAESGRLINDLFEAAINVVNKIGVWDGARLPPPGKGEVRLNFLVSDGLYFGQGPFNVLAADAMGAPVINAATELMVFLMGKVHA
jgi:hypothetical protein